MNNTSTKINFNSRLQINQAGRKTNYQLSTSEIKPIFQFIENVQREILVTEAIPITLIEFREWLKSKNPHDFRPTTMVSICCMVNVLMSYFSMNRQVNTLTAEDLEQFIKNSNGISNATKNQRIIFVKILVKIWKEHKFISDKIDFNPEKFKVIQSILPTPTSDEIFQLIHGASDKDLHDVLGCISMSGLRSAEVRNLKFRNIRQIKIGEDVYWVIVLDNAEGYITKSKKPRSIPILPELLKIIQGREKNEYVFTHRGKQWKKRTLQRQISDLCNKIFGHTNFTCHSLRRGYATYLYENNIPITKISKYLGHSKIETTQRHYLQYRLLGEDFSMLSGLKNSLISILLFINIFKEQICVNF